MWVNHQVSHHLLYCTNFHCSILFDNLFLLVPPLVLIQDSTKMVPIQLTLLAPSCISKLTKNKLSEVCPETFRKRVPKELLEKDETQNFCEFTASNPNLTPKMISYHYNGPCSVFFVVFKETTK